MTDRTPPTDEPTMEEILASIRKIISDDDKPVDEARDEAPPDDSPPPDEVSKDAPQETQEETLEPSPETPNFTDLEAMVSSGLTRATSHQIPPEIVDPPAGVPVEIIDESLEDLRALKRSMASASLENQLAEQSDIIFQEDDPNQAEKQSAPEPEPKPDPEDDVLTLTQMVNEDGSITNVLNKETVPAPAVVPVVEEAPAAEMVTLAESAPDDPLPVSYPSHKGGDELSSDELIANDALELMMVRTLRPMLKGWMDDNLQPIVEKMVREELRRRSMK